MVEANPSNRGIELAPNAGTVTDHELVLEPPDIYLDAHIMDLKFSPSCNMLALCQVTGNVRVYCYAENKMD